MPTRTTVPEVRQEFLRNQIRQCLAIDGQFAEVGVYQGGSAGIMVEEIGYLRRLHLFDTFSGMPDDCTEFDGHRPGDFANTSVDFVRYCLNGANVEFWPGTFPASAAWLPPSIRFALVHIDVDLYTSTLAACRFFWPRLALGGMLVFDDYGHHNCRGATRAVNEFFEPGQIEFTRQRRKSAGTRIVKTMGD